MLTTARPLFEHVPGSFCDPAGLAEQQAPGAVALIVVHYPTTPDPEPAVEQTAGTLPLAAANPVPAAAQRPHPTSPPSEEGIRRSREAVLGPTYDAFVAVSGRLLAVARTTPDYRFPVMPATALARFFEHRDAGQPVVLSLYQLDEIACARFLETVFYAECLKLHVDGPASADLVAHQIARSGCADGVLELNDFSDPAGPRLHLVDLAETYADETNLAHTLRPHLDGITGRALLYDRPKNRAAAADRTGRAFDLDGVIEQAVRLAAARRGHPTAPTAITPSVTVEAPEPEAEIAVVVEPAEIEPAASESTAPTPDPEDAAADHVETYLRDRAARPRLVEPTHPNAADLAALVAELQGGRAPEPLLPPQTPPEEPTPEPTPNPMPETTTAKTSPATDPTADADPDADPSADEPSPPSQGGIPPADGGPEDEPHPLALELDRLRAVTFALFEDAVDRDRAVAHRTHVLAEHALAHPVPAAHVVAYLRALLTDDPPRRWHFFKRQRAKTYESVAARLLAFHGTHAHNPDPAARQTLDEIARLWSRLHK